MVAETSMSDVAVDESAVSVGGIEFSKAVALTKGVTRKSSDCCAEEVNGCANCWAVESA
jgi:hypothetical protein